jgi:hypothetical protein
MGILFFVEMTFVKYIFKEDAIIVKFPFLKEQICYFKNIIGFAFMNVKSEGSIIIYSINGKITIKIEGKKLKQKINEFIKNNYEIIKNKNIKELEEKGIKYFDNKIKQIIFYKDRMEIYTSNIKVKTYNFDTDIINVKCFNSQILTFFTNDNKKIGINIYKSKGCIGLFEYIINKYNNGVRPNCT